MYALSRGYQWLSEYFYVLIFVKCPNICETSPQRVPVRNLREQAVHEFTACLLGLIFSIDMARNMRFNYEAGVGDPDGKMLGPVWCALKECGHELKLATKGALVTTGLYFRRREELMAPRP